MGHTNFIGFSANLMSSLADCRGKVESWAEREKKKADQMEQEYNKNLQQEQAKISSLEDQLLSIQFQLGLSVKESGRLKDANKTENSSIVQRQQYLQAEQKRLQSEIAQLEHQKEETSDTVQKLKEEEQREQARAASVRSQKRLVEESKEMTIEDLTRGIINYKYLGLDFQKAENTNLRFAFSQIDPTDPGKQFCFVAGVNDFDIYEVADCDPAIDPDAMERALDELNKTDDLGQFIMRMRAAFVELVETSA